MAPMKGGTHADQQVWKCVRGTLEKTLRCYPPSMRSKHPLTHLRASDIRGIAQLATQATEAVTGIVEGVHQSVWSTLGVPGGAEPGRNAGPDPRLKDDGASAVHEDPVLQMPSYRLREDETLDVPALSDEVANAVAVGARHDVLSDDRSLVEVERCVVRRGSDQLHAPFVGLMVRPSSNKGREEAVVDIDDPFRKAAAELLG